MIEWQSAEPFSVVTETAYHVVVICGYVFLWFLLSYVFKQRQVGPLKIFWTTLVVALIFVVVTRLILGVTLPAGVDIDSTTLGFEYGTGVPLTLATVVKMNVISLFQALFVFYLLLRFRDLVLFKRTKRSQRNWYLMLAFMGIASLSAIGKDPSTEIDLIQGLAVVPAVILMAINSFRVSWIVYLSFREKAAGIGLSILLMILLGICLSSSEALAGLEAYLRHYSYPLQLFTELTIAFGLLYGVTSFLFLIFHLPTTSDFQRKAGEVTAMHSLTNLVSQVFDPDKLYASITATPVDAGTAQMAWLALADVRSGTLRPRIVSAYNTTVDAIEEMVDVQSLYEELDARKAPVTIDEAAADHRINERPGGLIGSVLMTPLLSRNEMLGGLFVAKDVMQGFEKDDVEAISVYAAQAAIALENARLFEEQLEKERLSRELDIAREVQKKLLPHTLPQLRGLTIAASSVSAHEVGGDYYDFLELDDDRLAFIIADVSGKGTSAAFYMAELQGIFRSVSRLVSTPADFLEHANLALASALERHVFVSVIYGIVDVEKEEIVLARGGHCPAAMISLDGEARFIRTQGLGLGLDRTELFRRSLVEKRIRLQPGDVFTLYTDGVVESRNRDGSEYGYDRLLDALKTYRHEDAPELHESLLEDLDNFLEETEYDDDLTLVVLKWHGLKVAEMAAAEDPRAASRSTISGRTQHRIQSD
ncbi:MAG: GAF domain-containing SpoIIE family protein phosphatase [Rhodothermales bacterium]